MPENEHATQKDSGNQQAASSNEGVNALEGGVSAAIAFNEFRTTVEEIKSEIEELRNDAVAKVKQEAWIAKQNIRIARDEAIKAIKAATPSTGQAPIDPAGYADAPPYLNGSGPG